jgi:enolase
MSQTAIAAVHAREILNSSGLSILEIDVELADGTLGRATVPSGTSVESANNRERRMEEPYQGLGNNSRMAVQTAFEIIAHELNGLDAADRPDVDRRLMSLDRLGTVKGIGDSAILGASMAVAHAAAAHARQPLYRILNAPHGCILPVPMFTVLHGGAFADCEAILANFMIAPVGAPSFREALHMGVASYLSLKSLLRRRGLGTNVADDGGFIMNRIDDVAALDLLLEAVATAGFKPGIDFVLACDAAAHRCYDAGRYFFRAPEKKGWTARRLVDYYDRLCREYPIWSLENGLAAHDHKGMQLLADRLGSRLQLASNEQRPDANDNGAADGDLANAALIGLETAKTITGLLDRIQRERAARQGIVISDGTSEPDEFVADLSVAISAGQINTGAPAGTDHVAKYNRLLRIEEELGAESRYAGRGFVLWGGFLQ